MERMAGRKRLVEWTKDNVARSVMPSIMERLYADRLHRNITDLILGRIEKQVGKDREKVAILDGTTKDCRSFGDIHRDIGSISYGLANDCEVKRGTTVGLFTPNHCDFFSVFHGVSKLGGTTTPVNPMYTEYELGPQLESSNSTVVVSHPDHIDTVWKAAKQTNGVVKHVLCLEKDIGAWRSRYREEQTPSTESVRGNDTVLLPYSSGTTGKPKGTMLTHDNIHANILQCDAVEMRFWDEDKDKILSPLPMFHIYAFLVSLHLSIYKGCTLVTMKKFDLERYCQLVEEHGCTRTHIVPPIVLQLAKSPIVDRYDMSSLKWGLSAAAPLGAEVEREASERLGMNLVQCWGLSEISPIGTSVPDDEMRPGSGSVGVLVSDTEAKVVSLETGESLPPGGQGELCIRGPQVMKGYLNADTDQCLERDTGWLHTGDIAKIDDEGFVYILDRQKELIKYKGFQVAPAELEAVLCTHPDVNEATVIPVPDAEAGEIPRAYVVLKPNGKDKDQVVQEVLEYVGKRVAPHKKLRGGIVLIDEIPKTASGKILRRQVIELDRKRT